MITKNSSSVSGAAYGSLLKPLLSSGIPVGILEGENFTVKFASPELLKIWKESDSVFGKNLSQILSVQEHEILLSKLKEVYETGKSYTDSEVRTGAVDNESDGVQYFNFTYTPVSDPNAATVAILFIGQDVTEQVFSRKKIEQLEERHLTAITEHADKDRKAEEKQAMLAAIVNTSDDTIVSKTLQGIITSWNKAAERMFGYSEEEAIGKHISILIPTERLQEEDHIISNIARGNKVAHFETVRIAKDGRRIPISLSVSPIKDKDGNIIGASKIARDITAQKLAQQAAERYTESLEILNSIGRSISEELDLQKILQKVTDATTRLTGAQFGAFFYNTKKSNGEELSLYTLSGAAREDFEKFGIPRKTAVFEPTLSGIQALRSDDITRDERYGKNAPYKGMPEGHLPVKSYLAVPVKGRNGEAIGGLFYGHPEPGKFSKDHESLVTAIASQAAIGLDNATLYQEIKSLNSKKDEFIGLASHELKTPLTSISGYLQILERGLKNDHGRTFVSRTIQQVNKLTALVSDLLDVSKIEAGKLQLSKEDFDVREIIDDSIELIHLSNRTHSISLQSNLDHLLIHGDKQRLEQVIINLLTNAIKYSPNADHVEVLLLRENEGVKIGVRDSGMGIEADKIAQVFSRFYRVEGLSANISGLGIGLYIAKEIIERHGGQIWAESEPGKGSTFWILLPALGHH